LAEEALRRIGALYAVEAEVRGRPAEERRAGRQERSKPIVDALHNWLTVFRPTSKPSPTSRRSRGGSVSARANKYRCAE
jgi:Transposase IS66 family